MKNLLYLIILFIFTSCSTDKGTYWCGDHPCINKKEKEAYFKKTMIVEIKNLEKMNSKNNSEIEKIIQQSRKGEKKRIKNEKNMAKQAKLEDKKEEKYLTKQIERDEARIIKKEKKKSIQSVNINAGIESPAAISTNFNKLVEKITKKNIFRPYPDINDIRD